MKWSALKECIWVTLCNLKRLHLEIYVHIQLVVGNENRNVKGTRSIWEAVEGEKREKWHNCNLKKRKHLSWKEIGDTDIDSWAPREPAHTWVHINIYMHASTHKHAGSRVRPCSRSLLKAYAWLPNLIDRNRGKLNVIFFTYGFRLFVGQK